MSICFVDTHHLVLVVQTPQRTRTVTAVTAEWETWSPNIFTSGQTFPPEFWNVCPKTFYGAGGEWPPHRGHQLLPVNTQHQSVVINDRLQLFLVRKDCGRHWRVSVWTSVSHVVHEGTVISEQWAVNRCCRGPRWLPWGKGNQTGKYMKLFPPLQRAIRECNV